MMLSPQMMQIEFVGDHRRRWPNADTFERQPQAVSKGQVFIELNVFDMHQKLW
jgi:hypothetical protein